MQFLDFCIDADQSCYTVTGVIEFYTPPGVLMEQPIPVKESVGVLNIYFSKRFFSMPE